MFPATVLHSCPLKGQWSRWRKIRNRKICFWVNTYPKTVLKLWKSISDIETFKFNQNILLLFKDFNIFMVCYDFWYRTGFSSLKRTSFSWADKWQRLFQDALPKKETEAQITYLFFDNVQALSWENRRKRVLKKNRKQKIC